MQVSGAVGGGGGGYGAEMIGEFQLLAGDELSIVVGQSGSGIQTRAGGGGGSFVWMTNTATLLIAAGGGGGGGAMQNLVVMGIVTSGNDSGEWLVTRSRWLRRF